MDAISRIRELGYHSLEDFHLDAFSRNIGFLSRGELASLRHKKVAIPGLGGVGGLHLITHLRTGFCNFNVSDFDIFDVVNTNRQYGAKVSNLQKPKLDSMVQEALEINPFAQINTFPEGVNESNIDQFLDGVDIIIDSLDIFVVNLRLLLFKKAKEKNIPIVTAAPLGFGTSVIAFSPKEGMNFEEYFDIKKEMSEKEKFTRMVIGVAPKAYHTQYMDSLSIQPKIKKVPSLGAGCLLAASMACSVSTKIILGHKGVRYAPAYFAVDPYLQKVHKGKLYFGNRNPLQKLKIHFANKFIEQQMLEKDPTPNAPEFDRNSKTIPYNVKEFIVQAGTQAPSGENTQPWRFVIHEDRIVVKINPDADLSFFNLQKRASILAIGAAIENIKVAASNFGLSCYIQYHKSELDETREIAVIYLKNENIERDSLFRSIWERCTNRKQYSRKKIDSYVFEILQKEVADFGNGAKLHVLEDRTEMKKLKKALTAIGVVRTKNKMVHEFLHHHIRANFEEAKKMHTGFALSNLEGGKLGELVLKATKSWKVMNFLNKLGFAYPFAAKVEENILAAGASILITMPSNSVLDYLKGGQILERVWLRLTEMGISAQPGTSMNFFNLRSQLENGLQSFDSKDHKTIEKSFQEFNKIFPEVNMKTDGQIMLLRIGYSQGIKTWTVRYPVKSVIEPINISTSYKEVEKKLAVNQ